MDEKTIQNLLQIGENQNVEFKAGNRCSGDFRCKIATVIIAFSNTRGGGTLLIGVDNLSRTVTGLSDEDLNSYDITDISSYLKERCSSIPKFYLAKLIVDKKNIVVITVEEFGVQPTILRADIASDQKTHANAGEILIRNSLSSTAKIQTYEEMNELLSLAISRKSEELLSQIKKIITGDPKTSNPQEPIYPWVLLKGAMNKNAEFERKNLQYLKFELNLVPVPLLPADSYEYTILDKLKETQVRLRPIHTPRIEDQNIIHNLNEIHFEVNEGTVRQEWFLTHSGGFILKEVLWTELLPSSSFFNYPNPPERIIPISELIAKVTEYYRLASSYAEVLLLDKLFVRFCILNCKDRKLGNILPDLLLSQENLICREGNLEFEKIYEGSSLISDWKLESKKQIKRILTTFQLTGITDETIDGVQNLLYKRQI